MATPELLMLIRFRSKLTYDEVVRVVEERAPEFRALGGLQQKYYLYDAQAGAYAGLYVWESAEALEAYRNSELRASIAQAYHIQGEPRIEVYQVVKPLRE